MNIFSQYPVLVPALSVFTAEVLKLIITVYQKKTIHWRDFGRSGGIPSGHAALASSIAMSTLMIKGIDSIEFAIAAVFAVIVGYDAVKLRWEAGQHAKVLNFLLGKKKLEERLGHTFLEMLVGGFLGVALSFLLLSL